MLLIVLPYFCLREKVGECTSNIRQLNPVAVRKWMDVPVYYTCKSCRCEKVDGCTSNITHVNPVAVRKWMDVR